MEESNASSVRKLAEFSSAMVVTLYATINGKSTGEGKNKRDNGILPWAVGGDVAEKETECCGQPAATGTQPNEAGRTRARPKGKVKKGKAWPREEEKPSRATCAKELGTPQSGAAIRTEQ